MTIDLEERRALLIALRERILSAAEGITTDDDENAEINSAAGDQHLADHASEMVDRELDDTLGENAGHVIREIDDAIGRIESGSYGLCVICGRQIPEERLTAVPYATLCLEDKRKQEQG